MKHNEVLGVTIWLLFAVPMTLSAVRYLCLDLIFYYRNNWDFSEVPAWGRLWRTGGRQKHIPPQGKERLKNWFYTLVFLLPITVALLWQYGPIHYLQSLVALTKHAISSLL